MQRDRYHRQQLLPFIGEQGQQRLAAASVALVGCGALGSVIADQLVRAGVGRVRLIDRDIVELTNLQRQVLFDEDDARQGVPKAIAAANRLAKINSQVRVEPIVADVHSGNVEELLQSTNLILDGTDNVETRYLLNDVAIKRGIPWIYGACVGVEGRLMTIVPRTTACLRCIFPNPPAPGELPTCDTAGVLGPAAGTVASLQSAAAIKLLSGNSELPDQILVTIDLWNNRFRTIQTHRDDSCVACGRHQFEFLDRPSEGSTSLCGRNAVQVRPMGEFDFDSPLVEQKLRTLGEVERTRYLIRCRGVDGISLTLFPDGRLIVYGTNNFALARSLYARYIGS